MKILRLAFAAAVAASFAAPAFAESRCSEEQVLGYPAPVKTAATTPTPARKAVKR